MWSNAGMANRQGDVDLRFAQVSAPQLTLWLGLATPHRLLPAFEDGTDTWFRNVGKLHIDAGEIPKRTYTISKCYIYFILHTYVQKCFCTNINEISLTVLNM